MRPDFIPLLPWTLGRLIGELIGVIGLRMRWWR